ncbi:MAG: phytanoyl-CoA dioxygenase family protein [Archangium sp.]|nr:phytanoyl-CoA dioxygenase family protein [Archangium sp.]
MRSQLEEFVRLLRQPKGTSYASKFGGLWTDLSNAAELVDARAKERGWSSRLKENVAFFVEHGFVILKRAVPHADIDTYLGAFERALGDPSHPMRASVPGTRENPNTIVSAAEAPRLAPLTKYLDTYVHLPEARALMFAGPVLQFLQTIFDEADVKAFQGLHFETGSTQAIHQDSAYVVVNRPLWFSASWLALEDVVQGSGELCYYPGSHRFPDHVYPPKKKHWNPTDGNETHDEHLQELHEHAKARGIALEAFLPKKGDVLIWAADLAHGGSPITTPDSTRRSLVTHYCPASIDPYYLRFCPPGTKAIEVAKNAQCISMYHPNMGTSAS